jgi:mannose-1-phosphate guanylyltransferase
MLYAVIMAGGSGTRLWPESRKQCPKQLLNIQGKRTMIHATVDRLGALVGPNQVVIATTAELAGKIHTQLSQLPRDAVLCEPCPRNTAPCIGLAALRIVRQDPEAIMAVMPADHVIEPAETFQEAIRFAAALVEERPERLVTFGIRPTYPAESFGYIERQEPLASPVTSQFSRPPAAYRVKKFHEKPKREMAEQYVAAGTYSWNSGIFLWRAQTILDALARYQPAMYQRLRRIADAADSEQFGDVLSCEFAAIEGISIDYAVMEHSPDVVMIEAPFTWDDVGSWRSLERLRPVDDHGNLIDAAKHLEIDATGNIVRVQDPSHLVVLLGAKDLIVISTPTATLVADKSQEESIRKVIKELDDRGWRDYL